MARMSKFRRVALTPFVVVIGVILCPLAGISAVAAMLWQLSEWWKRRRSQHRATRTEHAWAKIRREDPRPWMQP